MIRRAILLSLVLLAYLELPGCGVTAWQRQQDQLSTALAELHSESMNRQIAEAK